MAFEILSVAWTRADRPSRRSQVEIDRLASRSERRAGLDELLPDRILALEPSLDVGDDDVLAASISTTNALP